MNVINVLDYLDNSILMGREKEAFVGEDESLSFGELRDNCYRIASAIIKRGIYRKPIAVYMKKSPMEVAVFLAVIAAGCFYVPLDEDMPEERIDRILKIAEPECVIGTDAILLKNICEKHRISEMGIVDELKGSAENKSALMEIRQKAIDTDPIYVVFTSGSTGTPKGVTACHRSVIDYVEHLSEVMGISEATIFGNQSPLYLDACLKELFPTLMFHATTYFIPKRLFRQPVELINYLNKNRINTICWVASQLTIISALNTFDTVEPQYLRTVAFGSEVFLPKHLKRWKKSAPEAVFINLYGPTECTGMSCYFVVNREFDESEAIPIGFPFKNTRVKLISFENPVHEVASGQVGEICILGTPVTLGYYGDFEMTRVSFVQNPLNDKYTEMMYRTGDLAMKNDRDELIFVSRKDFQIKHMGYRIELGEIEAAAANCAGVENTCCLYDKKRQKIWLVYCGEVSKEDLTDALEKKLPRYMIPNHFEKLEKLPYTEGGKIDRKQLEGMIG